MKLTWISVIIYVSDCSDAFSKMCIESIVTTQNTFLLHHPLKTTAGKIKVYILSWQKKTEMSNRVSEFIAAFPIKFFGLDSLTTK